MKCVICNDKEGTKTITDATNFPEKYNNKPICDDCQKDREYLKSDEHE